MCVHTIANHDLLERPFDQLLHDTDDNNCDYIDSNERLQLNQSDLCVLQLNIRGLYSKLENLKSLLNDNFKDGMPDILLLCETWQNTHSPKIHLKGFQMFEQRRLHKKGGGTSVIIKEGYTSKRIRNPEIDFETIEHCLVEVSIENKSYIVGSLYRAPNTNQKDFLKEYKSLIDYVHSKKPYGIILGMDHNLDLLKTANHYNTQEFLNINLEKGLIPTINRPTRITHSSATLIDNIVVSQNFGGKYHSSIIIDDISDHLPCITILENFQRLNRSKITVTSRDTRKSQIDKLKQALANYSPTDTKNLTADEYFNDFHDYITMKVEEYCPTNTREIPVNKFRVNPWMTRGLMKSINRAKNLYQLTLKKESSELDLCKYKTYRNILNTLKRRCRETYYKDKCHEYRRNMKKLWNLINEVIHKNNDKSSVVESLKIGNIITYNKTEISNQFGKYFSSVGHKFASKIKAPKNNATDYLKLLNYNEKSLFMTPTSKEEIAKLINNLPPKKSSGHDNIDNILLKEIRHEISNTLSNIFNMSISTGTFPTRMKLAEVVPLFKSKDRQLTENYRPISLLVTISKILEKIIYRRTYGFLQQTHQLYNSQYGFRTDHSCENAISELLGSILKAKEKGYSTACLYLDLSKAFDTLEHDMLLSKMKIYGIRGKANSWFKSYLNNRSLKAKCNKTSSEQYNVEYGTPQGSCLGPLLFIIFCNDLHLHLTYLSCIQFADDTTLYCSEKDIRLLESNFMHDLTAVSDWFRANKLTLNAGKSVCMLFQPKGEQPKKIKIELDDVTITNSKFTKFLGLWIDDKLDWHIHLSKLQTKLNQSLGLLNRAKKMLNLNGILSLYYAHFVSHLTYGIPLWGSMASNQWLTKLQKIQNKCLRIVLSKSGNKTRKDLLVLNVKETIDLDLCKLGYKTKNNLLPTQLQFCIEHDSSGRSLKKNHPYNTRRKQELNIPKTNYASFLNKATKLYTDLPKDLKSIPTLKCFIKKTKQHLIS